MQTKNDSYWLTAANDIRLFCKGKMSIEKLSETYVELDIRRSWSSFAYDEAIAFVIPKDCPFEMALQIVLSTWEEGDKNEVRELEWHFPYQKEWELLPQIGSLEKISTKQEDVIFHCSVRTNDVELMYCIKRGDCGDCDGYGMEDDIWLRALIHRNGEWKQPFHIHS